MNFKAFFRYIMAAVAIVLYNTIVVSAANVSKDDLKKVEEKVLQQTIEHKKLQAQATQINMELASVSQEMIRAAKKIQNSEDRLSLMEKQLLLLESDLDKAQKGFEQEDDSLIKTTTALQNLALKPTESLLVQPLSPVDIIRSAMILRETIPHLENNASLIRKKLESLSEKKSKIEKQIAEISKQKLILQAEHSRMNSLMIRKANLRKSVTLKSEQAKSNMDKLASQAQDLRDLLGKIEKQRLEKERQAAERKRLEEKRKLEEKQSSGLIKDKKDDITDTSSGFAKAKGNLSLPARGNIITQYGEQKVKGVSSKGITIATRSNAQVIAPFDGSVVFTGPFRGYGNMIIIEHDGGYLSLLAGLGVINVDLGQMLLAGEPVGQMPNGGSELYVEIRKNNQPINPKAWFKF